MAISSTLEQREQIQLLSAQGVKSADIAEQIGLSFWTVRKWRQRLKKGGLSYPIWAAA